jgi:hypothetical protein
MSCNKPTFGDYADAFLASRRNITVRSTKYRHPFGIAWRDPRSGRRHWRRLGSITRPGTSDNGGRH